MITEQTKCLNCGKTPAQHGITFDWPNDAKFFVCDDGRAFLPQQAPVFSTEIQDGDSNEVCLAKIMYQIDELMQSGSGSIISEINEGMQYASKILHARDD